MNSTNQTSLTMMNEISLSLMKEQTFAYVLWVVSGTTNALTSIFTMAVIMVWKPLRTDTQMLVANAAFAEIVGGLTLAVAGCYHLFSISHAYPETTVKKNCYLKFGIIFFCIQESAFFYLAISVDRFLASIFPHFYNNRSKIYVILKCIVFWLVPSILFACTFLELDEKAFIPICLVRAATGDTIYFIYNNLLFTVSTTTVLIYVLTLLILKYQISVAVTSNNSNSNISEIKRRMHNKATITLLITAVLQLVTFTTSTLGSVVLTNYTYKGTTYGPYLSILYFMGGMQLFVIYFLRQKKFRDGFQYTIQLMKTKLKITKIPIPININNANHSSSQRSQQELQEISKRKNF